jgi:hypothetical protein
LAIEEKGVTSGRCLNCRAPVAVRDAFADGDTIRCGVCGMSLKVQRAGGLRLPIADVAPLRDEIKSIQQRLRGLESDRARARASFGIGANGLGLGVLYVVYQVGLKEEQFSRALFWEAAAAVLLTGVALELANFLFLAKRQQLSRLSADIAQAHADVGQLQDKIRESLPR